MQQVKIFIDLESNYEAMEERINSWLKSENVNVISINGSIAPQSPGGDGAGSTRLGGNRFPSSDLMVIVHYETS